MKRGHLLQDPSLSAILAEAERVLVAADDQAKALGSMMTDSNARQILLLALHEGEPVNHPRPSKKELFYLATAQALEAKFQEMEIPREDWLLTLRAMLDHIEAESPRLPRVRDYLEQIRKAVG